MLKPSLTPSFQAASHRNRWLQGLGAAIAQLSTPSIPNIVKRRGLGALIAGFDGVDGGGLSIPARTDDYPTQGSGRYRLYTALST